MKFEDITVVVQGPVQVYDNRAIEESITQKCLSSVRTFLPGAKIILSTWHNQDLSGLDYDELLLNDDPGANIRHYTKNKKPRRLNNNRQIVSTLNGLRAVSTPYAMKLRTDNYLTSADFISLQQKFTLRHTEDSVFKERVVIVNTFSRKFAKGLPVAYHLSDFFYFGLTEDLVKLWDIPLLTDYDLTEARIPNPHYPYFPIDCTQLFWQLGLQNFGFNTHLNHLHDVSDDKLERNARFIAHNLVIGAPEDIGLGLCSKFLGKARVNRVTGRTSFYQLSDWLRLYNEYARGNEPVNPWPQALLEIQRLTLIRPVAIETRLKLIKRLFAHF